eukprot:5121851-Prymnesium_polylepis.1
MRDEPPPAEGHRSAVSRRRRGLCDRGRVVRRAAVSPRHADGGADCWPSGTCCHRWQSFGAWRCGASRFAQHSEGGVNLAAPPQPPPNLKSGWREHV